MDTISPFSLSKNRLKLYFFPLVIFCPSIPSNNAKVKIAPHFFRVSFSCFKIIVTLACQLTSQGKITEVLFWWQVRLVNREQVILLREIYSFLLKDKVENKVKGDKYSICIFPINFYDLCLTFHYLHTWYLLLLHPELPQDFIGRTPFLLWTDFPYLNPFKLCLHMGFHHHFQSAFISPFLIPLIYWKSLMC